MHIIITKCNKYKKCWYTNRIFWDSIPISAFFDCNSYNFYYFYRKLILKAYGTMRKSNRSANLTCCPLKNYF